MIYVKIDLSVIDLMSSEYSKCIPQFEHECLKDKMRETNTTCALPFDNEALKDIPICSSYIDGLKVVDNMLSKKISCLDSCLQLNADFNEEIPNYIQTLARPKVTKTFSDVANLTGYEFSVPKNFKVYTNSYEYTKTVALGYFGSMIGILTGISVMKLLEWMFSNDKIKESGKYWILLFAKIVALLHLSYVFGILLMKFLENPHSTKVKFAKTSSDLSLTVCSTPYTYGLVNNHSTVASISYDSFLPKQSSFRQKWTNISSMVDTIILNNGSHHIDLLSNIDLENVKFFLLPKDKFTVSVCNSFGLAMFQSLDSIKIFYNSELEMYLHNSGQFIYEWKKANNIILSGTKENIDFKDLVVNVYDTDIILKLEKEFKLTTDVTAYDDCIIDQLNSAVGLSQTKCFFSRNYSRCLDYTDKQTFQQVQNQIKHVQKCNHPGKTLSISHYRSRLLQKNKITVQLSETAVDITGDLGLSERPTEKKPCINLILPRFTKISEVIIKINEKIIFNEYIRE